MALGGLALARSRHTPLIHIGLCQLLVAATLAPTDGGWRVREGGQVKLWERIERVLDAYDAAGAPGPETFTLHVYDGGQHLRHSQLPGLPLLRP